MIQVDFANNAKKTLENDPDVLGLAVAGSWLTNSLDAYSDLDLVLVTKQKISDNITRMKEYAKRLGNFLSGFTGEHVGEPRLLICLYDKPLLHVDIKFLTLSEFAQRIENPFLLLDKTGTLQKIINESSYSFPYPDYQWIEDRFWIWVHYCLLKIGRGEYLEAYDFFGFLRMVVFGPLLHIKNGKLPRSVRKVESELPSADLEFLTTTLPQYNRASLVDALKSSIRLYRHLRSSLYTGAVMLQLETENAVIHYLEQIENE